MGRLSVGLLRKRAEHNEGCLSTLVEIALHQQELEKLEVIGDACRNLEILYLCNNYIPKIENLHHLKKLTYLNLAVNNIKIIEGLEGCESLERLDLTLNFVADLSGVKTLQANIFLDTLYLTGNPCTNVNGYKQFVLEALPQLLHLDGDDVKRSQQITARQEKAGTTKTFDKEKVKFNEQERLHQEMKEKGIDPFPPKYNDEGERVYGHSAEERVQMLRETEEQEEKKRNPAPEPGSISALHAEINKKRERPTVAQELEKYGRIIMRNEGKIPFRPDDEDDTKFVLHVECGKFISTELIKIDADVNYIQVLVKEKMLRMATPHEIAVDKISVQRAKTTGALCITMPYAAHVLQAVQAKKDKYKWMDEDDDDILAKEEREAEEKIKKKIEESGLPKGSAAETEAKAAGLPTSFSSTKAMDDAVKTRRDVAAEGAIFKEVSVEEREKMRKQHLEEASKPATNLPSRDAKGKKIESFVEEIE